MNLLKISEGNTNPLNTLALVVARVYNAKRNEDRSVVALKIPENLTREA